MVKFKTPAVQRSRRELLRRGALGLGLVALGAACAPSTSPSSASGGAGAPAASGRPGQRAQQRPGRQTGRWRRTDRASW